MRAPKNPTPQYTDLAAFIAAQTNPATAQAAAGKKSSRTLKRWALDHRGQLALAATAASLGPAGELLSTTGDGWRTALTLGAAGAVTAGAWGWLPGLVKWNGIWRPARTLPGAFDRYTGLSMPVTGAGLLTTMAFVGGPEWGDNPWWGFSLLWSMGYGTWAWRRWGRRPEAKSPELAQQMLDWIQYAAVSDGPYPKSQLVSPIATAKGGWSAEIHMPRGKSFKIQALDDVLSALGIDDPDLVALERFAPRKGKITVFTENPLKKGNLFGEQHVLDPETGLAPIGIFYDGVIANYRFFLPGSGAVHSFVTGTSGSGKSRLLDALLGIERRSPLVCSIVIDPQKGLSLPDWPDGVAVFAPGNDFGIVVLRAVHAIMHERSERYNRMKWTDEKGRTRVGRAFFVPGDPDPLLSLTLDEAHDLLNDPEYGEEAVKIVGDLAKEARKVGIKFRLANQSPNASELGGETLIRDILQGGNNAVLRSGSSATGKRAAGSALDGVDPGAIPKEFSDGTSTGGLGYLAGPDNRTAMWRAPNVEDAYGLAHEGFTTGIEQASIDALPIVRHILDEHALMLRLRNAGERYTYDPDRFDDTPAAPAAPPVSTRKKATVPAQATAQAPEPVPTAVEPVKPGLSATGKKVVAFLQQHGKPVSPAIIAKSLGMPGPQVRTALKRMKDDPTIPVVNVGHGAWVHEDHAADYMAAA
ncbi:hypothetical protein [Streptomyces durocortorensis]|uniref:Cell division protein FtsK n=1 Tax=Streptomyces durocortorensis TaxID=2811104 RepID=A0ABS2I747_9ACTN|nr:hypothetical protein [Streptomyces durocortorensis]MBM7058817.1 hypothetical protein [Streptomyces durocortorensis]